MQGYFNRPEATAAVMRDGWFLTGDLGRLDAERSADDHRPQEGSDRPRIRQEHLSGGDRGLLPPIGVREGDLRARADVGGRPDDASGCSPSSCPNMDLMRERKIVNAGDLLRFELEGQAVHLPAHKRVLGYDIWFEPLPRTTTGKLKRHEIERRLRQQAARSGRRGSPSSAVPETDVGRRSACDRGGRHHRDSAARAARFAPDANLELDLGLDSMERVELITELEQRFGVQLQRRAGAPGADGRAADRRRSAGRGQRRDRRRGGFVGGHAPRSAAAGRSGARQPARAASVGRAAVLPVLSRVAAASSRSSTVTGLEHLPPAARTSSARTIRATSTRSSSTAFCPTASSSSCSSSGAAEYFETP